MGDSVLRAGRWQGGRRQAHREVFTASRARPCRLSSFRISISRDASGAGPHSPQAFSISRVHEGIAIFPTTGKRWIDRYFS
jgi:hypothetical protein